MKQIKGLLFLAAISLASCQAPRGSVDGFQMKNGQICGNGTVTIITPSQAQADSAVAAISKNLVEIKHLSDSAGVHVYGWSVCSPVINTQNSK